MSHPSKPLNEIMTREVLTVGAEQSLREAVTLFSEEGVSGAPVVAGTRVVGVISAADIIDYIAVSGVDPRRRKPSAAGAFYTDLWSFEIATEPVDRFERLLAPHESALDEHTVADAMTRTLETLPPSETAAAAAAKMLDAGIHRVLIMEDAELRGIVTTTDLLRMVAAGH